jgi:hypothetical protein
MYVARPIGIMLALAAMLVISTAQAQVMIDMPKAPKKVATPAATVTSATGASVPSSVGSYAATTSGYAASSSSVDVGEVALTRYSRARYGTYGTYNVGPRYAGYRSYSYPVYYGYPFFWGWPFFHGCGTHFSGFVR